MRHYYLHYPQLLRLRLLAKKVISDEMKYHLKYTPASKEIITNYVVKEAMRLHSPFFRNASIENVFTDGKNKFFFYGDLFIAIFEDIEIPDFEVKSKGLFQKIKRFFGKIIGMSQDKDFFSSLEDKISIKQKDERLIVCFNTKYVVSPFEHLSKIFEYLDLSPNNFGY